MPVAHCERLGQRVVVGQIRVGVIAHRGCRLVRRVRSCEAVTEVERRIRIAEVGFEVRLDPLVLRIAGAITRLVRNCDAVAIERIVVAARKFAFRTGSTIEPVDALMVVRIARTACLGRRMIMRILCPRQGSEIIVERVVLLRQDDDVIDMIESSARR
jgi:hypothetical protein